MDHVSDQTKPEELILPSVRESQASEFGSNENYTDIDELFHEAVSIAVTHQQGSISLLQRRLKIGYSRAARLIDEMEQGAVVGPFTGSKARSLQSYMANLEGDFTGCSYGLCYGGCNVFIFSTIRSGFKIPVRIIT